MMERNPPFSWRNYGRPTPKNLLSLAAAMRRMVAIAAGTTTLADANHWITFTIIMTGAALDELKNFFAIVVHDTEEATAQFPSGEEVTVTRAIPDNKPLDSGEQEI